MTAHDSAPTLRAVRVPPRPERRTAMPSPGAPPRRSLTPPTLRTADVHRLSVVLERLRFALRSAETLGQLRTYVVELAADVESVVTDDRAAPTLRVSEVAPDTLPSPMAALTALAAESAPSTPYGSALAEEFGPGESEWYAARGGSENGA